MAPGEKNLQVLLRSMNPVLQEEPFVFCSADAPEAIATFREAEGITSIVPRPVADSRRYAYSYVAAWIILMVESDLNAVGFLAVITDRLAGAGISCNVMSALHHDHLFVPYDRRDEAMNVLRDLQADV